MADIIRQNWNLIIDVLLVVVGLSAFVIYCAQRRTIVYSAGTMIVGQVKLIEQNIQSLKGDNQLGNIAVYHSKPIIKENMWEQYKHLFAKRLTGAEYELVQHFFDHAEQLERARLDIISTIVNGWKDKSSVEHQVVAQMLTGGATNEQIDTFRMQYRPLDMVFTPNIAIEALTKSLDTFSALVGTTAFAKLAKRSYSK